LLFRSRVRSPVKFPISAGIVVISVIEIIRSEVILLSVTTGGGDSSSTVIVRPFTLRMACTAARSPSSVPTVDFFAQDIPHAAMSKIKQNTSDLFIKYLLGLFSLLLAGPLQFAERFFH
jgi:hypothetical protein